jgi:hypothetical protein
MVTFIPLSRASVCPDGSPLLNGWAHVLALSLGYSGTVAISSAAPWLEVPPLQGAQLGHEQTTHVQQPQQRPVAPARLERHDRLHLLLGQDALGEGVLDARQRERRPHVVRQVAGALAEAE